MKKIDLLIFILVTLNVSVQQWGTEAISKPPDVEKPKLVLAIIADQFRYDYLLRFREQYREAESSCD